MRVLSIDLDYIMGPVIELYNGLMFNENPTIRWEQFFNVVPEFLTQKDKAKTE